VSNCAGLRRYRTKQRSIKDEWKEGGLIFMNKGVVCLNLDLLELGPSGVFTTIESVLKRWYKQYCI
jgi:hypothetical protein